MKKKTIVVEILTVVALIAIIALVLGIGHWRRTHWLEKCRVAYQKLQNTETMLYTIDETVRFSDDKPFSASSFYKCWLDGEDFFSYKDVDVTSTCEYKLRVGQEKYQYNDKEKVWTSPEEIYFSGFWDYYSWDEFQQYREVSVKTTASGTEVTFFRDLGVGSCYVVHSTHSYVFSFDRKGAFSGVKELSTDRDPDGTLSRETQKVYTVHACDKDAIREKIQEAYSKVPGKG